MTEIAVGITSLSNPRTAQQAIMARRATSARLAATPWLRGRRRSALASRGHKLPLTRRSSGSLPAAAGPR